MYNVLIPYDELKIDFDEKNNTLNLQVPWLKIATQVEIENPEILKQCLHNLQTNQMTASDLQTISTVLESFNKYPVYYIVPSPKKGDEFQIVDDKLIGKTLFESLSQISSLEKNSLEGINTGNILEMQSAASRKDFNWNIEEALDFCSVENQIHPESLLTVARRYYMLDSVENSKVVTVYQQIKSLPNDLRSKAVAFIVRQNHYVTERCLGSVTPALLNSQSAKPLVEEFLREETGHDAILGRALKELGFQKENLPVSINAKVIMDLLAFAAKRNFLAFAIMIDFFERSNYSETDPLADLLTDCGMASAAKFINVHMNINDAGGHELMSLQFLNTMAPCSKEYATEALMLAELISVFMNRVSTETLNIFNKCK